MTRCSLDLDKVADGWNAMSTDISAYCWKELFENKLGLGYDVAPENNDIDNGSSVADPTPSSPEEPAPLNLQDSRTKEALKDLAK